MQVVDDDVPFILGADFLLDHECLINYRTQELLIPPTETDAASSTPITVNGAVKESMVTALFPSDSFSTEEQTHMETQQEHPSYAIASITDEVIWPGHYAHVDLKVLKGDCLHESDQLRLQPSLMVTTDYDKITEADEIEFESDPWVCSVNSTLKALCHRARTAQVAAHRAQGLAPAMFEAVVTPWMDEGTDWVGVSSIVHNTGVEPLVLRQNQVVGTVSVITDTERGPRLLQPETASQTTPEDLSMHAISAIQAQIADGKQFLLPEGD